MAVPKYRASKARSRRRRSINSKLTIPGLVTCTNCGNMIVRHRICPQCGFYRGKQVIDPEELS